MVLFFISPSSKILTKLDIYVDFDIVLTPSNSNHQNQLIFVVKYACKHHMLFYYLIWSYPVPPNLYILLWWWLKVGIFQCFSKNILVILSYIEYALMPKNVKILNQNSENENMEGFVKLQKQNYIFYIFHKKSNCQRATSVFYG